MRKLALCLAIASTNVGCGSAPPPTPVGVAPVDNEGATFAIARVLDDFHDAAAQADEARYFAHFASDAVFLGTDATERWDVAAFRAYAHPHFAKGKAWSFRATRRAIAFSPDGRLAWFDEDLATERLGPARGSGVVVLVAGKWKIAQYNLTIVVPNDHFDAVRAAIAQPATASLAPFHERFDAAHARAVVAAKQGDFKQAEDELRALVAEAEAGANGSLPIQLHSELTWCRWSDGDLAGAYAELDAGTSAHLTSKLMGNMSVGIRVSHERERALLLREMAHGAPPTLRADALASANAARALYEKDGAMFGDQSGLAVVAALFAARAGDAKAALDAAKRVIALEDHDPLDLYVVALAFDAGKDRARADAIRATIRGLPDDIMKLVVVRRMDADAKPRGG